jgi:type I restriction enzyme, S subunit
MKSEWISYALSDVIDIIGGGTPKRSIKEYWGGAINWLSVVDFNSDNKYVSDTAEYITELGLKKSSTRKLSIGQLIISARGTVGALAQLTKPMAFNQSCYGLNANLEFTNNDFLYYLVKHKVSNLQQITHGAVFDTITRETFKHIAIDLPPLPTQKTIAHILSTLDDKIELNRKMNETLESMAQAIFKSWFVDFDPVHAKAGANSEDELDKAAKDLGISREVLDLFPSEFEESELGLIPKGWEVKALDDVTSKFATGLNPRKNFVLGEGENYYVTIKNMGDQDVVLDDKCDKITDEAIIKINRRSDLKKGDMLFSGIGTIGRVFYLHETPRNWNISESVFTIRADVQQCTEEILYLTLLSNKLQGYAKQLASGSVQKGIRMGDLKAFNVVVPNISIQSKLSAIMSLLIKEIKANNQGTQTLQKTRDTLLPKLLSGELDVSNLDLGLSDD